MHKLSLSQITSRTAFAFGTSLLVSLAACSSSTPDDGATTANDSALTASKLAGLVDFDDQPRISGIPSPK